MSWRQSATGFSPARSVFCVACAGHGSRHGAADRNPPYTTSCAAVPRYGDLQCLDPPDRNDTAAYVFNLPRRTNYCGLNAAVR